MIFVLPAKGQEAGTGSFCGSYRVVHINGIRTTQEQAERNVIALRDGYGSRFRSSQLSYHLGYNPTGGLLPDLAQVLAQKQAEFPGATIVQMLRYLLVGVGGSLPSALVNQLATYWAGWVNGNGSSYNTYSDGALWQLVETVRAHAMPDRRVLLVPHSQGNLYANRVVEIITSEPAPGWWRPVPEKSIGIVGVATPAAYVAGQRSSHKLHLTSSNDLIINGLRNGAPPLTGPQVVLMPNIDIALSTADPTGHGFRETYLGTDAGSAAVLGAMHAVLSALLSNVPSSETALALFDGSYTIASPERPQRASNGQWFTSPFISYSDEMLNPIAREGGLGLVEGLVTDVARSCAVREVASMARGQAAQPPRYDRLGACNIEDESGWRGFLPTIAQHDEILISADVSTHPMGGFADVYVIGQCRNT
ncbi:MAG: hypothetical protein MUC68_16120 [Burkholderiaceae bacterium]|nr:hypothetical protein [Burkholderiaceae bacterium]